MINKIDTNSNIVYNSSTKKDNTDRNALIGAITGTLVPLTYIAKTKKTPNILKLDYGIKDMLILSSTGIAGGTIGGMWGKTNSAKKEKCKESVFQLFNSTLPALTVGGGLKIVENFKKTNNVTGKFVATTIGLIGGMVGAEKLSNIVVDPKDKEPDRKITLKDSVANIDDAVGALTLAKFPLIKNLKVEKILPAIYTYCGYRAGSTMPISKYHKTDNQKTT